eukprot:scaffold16932_cov145-Skeletonema_marinoi.AAC.7
MNTISIQHVIHNDTLVILTFKAARSGSTFFSTVLVKALQAMKTSLNKTAYLNWEPYCRVGCYQLKSPALMESELSTILSSNCTNMTENPDPPLCNTPNTHKKCCPIPNCHANHSRSAISVLSLNPRFRTACVGTRFYLHPSHGPPLQGCLTFVGQISLSLPTASITTMAVTPLMMET